MIYYLAYLVINSGDKGEGGSKISKNDDDFYEQPPLNH